MPIHAPLLRLTLAWFLAVLASGCATLPAREGRPTQRSCEFTVYNHTSHALEIRMAAGALAPRPIGALNPGELLIHAAPCAEQSVWIGGFPILQQAGPPVRFAMVGASAALVEGTRVEVPLYGQ